MNVQQKQDTGKVGSKLTARFKGKAVNKKAGPDLALFLDEEIRPRLTAEMLFVHPAHKWQKNGDKWRGGCPWHDSHSGTAFYIDELALTWRCPACNRGGGPVQYLHQLQGGSGSPRGADFVDVLRKLAELVNIPFPEAELTEEQREHARLRDVRRAILEDTYRHCAALLSTDAGANARAWLATRGFDAVAIQTLGLGLYPEPVELARYLVAQGHNRKDVQASGVLLAKMTGFVVWSWRDDRGQALTLYGKWPGSTPPEGIPKTLALGNPKDKAGEDQERTKRSPLYVDQALRAGHKDLVLVEGVTDAALPQALGDHRVVACVGAQLSGLQSETLRRRSIESVTIALDPDQAGDNGIESCVRQLHEAGIRAYVAQRLPDGMDPDEFIIAHGIEAWRTHTAKRVHAYRWQAQRLVERAGPREAGDDGWGDQIAEAAIDFAAGLPRERHEELARHFWPVIAESIGSNAEDLRRRAEAARRVSASGCEPEETGRLQTSCISGLRPKPIRWISPKRIPLGKVVLVAGDGGHGKSMVTLHLTARLSRGEPAFGLDDPDSIRGETLLIQCEDDWEDTVLPRLLALGADLAKIHRQEGIRGCDGKVMPFCLAHYAALEKTLEENPVIKLVVIDPAGAYIGSGIDDHKDSELRSLLGPLAELAARCGVTILLVKHFSKAPTVKAVNKISGSTGYVNAVRAAFVVLPDEENTDRALFLPVKFNIGRRPKGLAFRRVELPSAKVDEILRPFSELTADDRQRIGEAIFTLEWEGEVDATADDQLADAQRSERGPNKVEKCTEWLKQFLAEYAYPSDEIKAAASKAGFSFDNLKQAKKILKSDGLVSTNQGTFGGVWWNGFGRPDQWLRRPEKSASPDSPHSPQCGKPSENHRDSSIVGNVGNVGSGPLTGRAIGGSSANGDCADEWLVPFDTGRTPYDRSGD
jgi:DNA primase